MARRGTLAELRLTRRQEGPLPNHVNGCLFYRWHWRWATYED